MRTNSTWNRPGSTNRGNNAQQHAATVVAEIEFAGVDLTVTSPGIANSTRTIRFMPQELAESSGGTLDTEAGNDVADGRPIDFVAIGATVVYPADLIGPWDGWLWQVVGRPRCDSHQGVAIVRHCVARPYKAAS